MVNPPSNRESKDEGRHIENRRIPRHVRDGSACHDILCLEEILVPTEVSVDELFSSVRNDTSGDSQRPEHNSAMSHSQGRRNESIR